MKKAISNWAAVPLVILSAVLLLLASCTPSWFPDGESFVSVGPMGDVVIHHIASKKTIGLSITGLSPVSVAAAVSPDGKTVAICAVTSIKASERQEVRWVFYDAKGKLISKEGPFALEHLAVVDKKKGDSPRFLSCVWSSDGKHILASIPNADAAFAWQVETKTTIEYDSLETISALLGGEISWMHQYPACLPDGRGFLAVKEGKVIVQLWDPKKSEPITTHESAKENNVTEMMKEDSKFRILLSPYWKDNRFVAPFGAGEFVIDANAHEFRYEQNKDNKLLNEFALKEEIVFLHQFRNGSLLGMNPKAKKHQLYYFDAMQKSATAITSFPKESELPVFTPAPKNDRTIITFLGPESRLVVADETGEIAYRYDTFRKVPLSEKP